MCQPLVVAQRPDGALYLVDGQHRHAAARLRGDIYDLPCVVHTYDDAANEAKHFVALNQQRRPLGALDLFKAALVGGDAGARAVMLLLEESGLSLAPHTNFTAWKPGTVSNIGGILRCQRVHGDALTASALTALARGFEGEVLRYAGTVFAGLVAVYAEPPRPIDQGLMVMVLSGATQAEWMKEIAAIEADRAVHRSVAAGIAVREAYLEAVAEDELEDEAA